MHRSQLHRSQWAMIGGAVCLVAALTATLAINGQADEPKAKDTKVYELRVYHVAPGKLAALHARFRDYTIKLFEKHGMHNIMYWTPTDEKTSQNTLIYVISHDSLDAAKKSWADFQNDPDWVAAKNASEKDGKLVDSVDSTYMTVADFWQGQK